MDPSQERAKVWRSAWTYTQKICTDTGYSFEDIPGTIDDGDGWRQRVRDIPVDSVKEQW